MLTERSRLLLTGGVTLATGAGLLTVAMVPPSPSLLLGLGGVLVAEEILRTLLHLSGLRLTDPAGLAALWQDIPRRAVDAVLPDPRARRGEADIQAGTPGRIVGQHPDRPLPLLAANALTYADLCDAFDQDNATLIETRARWMVRVGQPSVGLVTALDAIIHSGWIALLMLLFLGAAVGLDSMAQGLLLTGILLLSALPVLVLYGLLSAAVGLGAWLRAGKLSVQAEQDGLRAVRDDAARRASAQSILDEMRGPAATATVIAPESTAR